MTSTVAMIAADLGNNLTEGEREELRKMDLQLWEARNCVAMLVHAAGGQVEIKASHMVTYDPHSELITFDDPMSGARIVRLRSSHSALPQQPTGESK